MDARASRGGFYANCRELVVIFYSGDSNLSTCLLVYLSTILITKKCEKDERGRKLNGCQGIHKIFGLQKCAAKGRND